MGVHSHRRLAERHVQHHVRCLAAHAWQSFERRAVMRHIAAMVTQQDFRQGDHVAGFPLPQPDRAYVPAYAFHAQADHLRGAWRLGEQADRRLVDRRVGGLGGKHDGYQQCVRVGEGQLALCVRAGGSDGLQERAYVCAWHACGWARLGFGHGGFRHLATGRVCPIVWCDAGWGRLGKKGLLF